MANNFKDLIFYEIYPTSFYDSNNDGIGDLKGMEEKLDYIKELGCNAIWLNPFYDSPFKDGGYDVRNFKKVDSKFGTNKDFVSLIKKAHSLGLKIIIDLVPGHASEKNRYFLKSAEPIKNEYSDLFIWNSCVWDLENGYRLISGRYDRNACYLVNFFSTQPAFNYGFKDIQYPTWQLSYKDERTFKARDFMVDVMRFWLKLGADGFRVDMADSLVKNDEDKSATIEVWNYIFKKIKKEYPNTYLVSEWASPWRALKAGFEADFILPTHQDMFMHYFGRAGEGNNIFDGKNIEYFISRFKDCYAAAKYYDKNLAIISGNHDITRIASLLNDKQLKLFYLILFYLPGTPFLYYGDEIGMKHSDLASKDGGYQRTGDRTPMQWNLKMNAGFSNTKKDLYLPVFNADKVNVEENINNKDSLYHLIKKLIKLRKENDDFKNIDIDCYFEKNLLHFKNKKTELIINLGKEEITLNDKIIFSIGTDNKINYLEGAIIKNGN